MDKTVDRYDWFARGDMGGMGKDPDGEFVSYEDYKVLLDECDSLRGMLKNVGLFYDE